MLSAEDITWLHRLTGYSEDDIRAAAQRVDGWGFQHLSAQMGYTSPLDVRAPPLAPTADNAADRSPGAAAAYLTPDGGLDDLHHPVSPNGACDEDGSPDRRGVRAPAPPAPSPSPKATEEAAPAP